MSKKNYQKISKTWNYRVHADYFNVIANAIVL